MMNNVQRAQIWALSMMVVGMIILLVIWESVWFDDWFNEHMPWSMMISLSVMALYIAMMVMVAEFFLKKDGYEIYIRSKW